MLQDKEIALLDDERHAGEPAPSAEEAETESLTSQLSALLDDVRILAQAEVEYFRTKLSVNMAATRNLLVLFGIGVVVGIMAIVALVLGLLLVLADHIGPLAATAVVGGVALLIASLMIGTAIKRAKRLPLDEKDA